MADGNFAHAIHRHAEAYNYRGNLCIFYGNGIPADLAYQMYEACSRMSRTGLKKEVCDMYRWFQTVDDGCGLCLASYYNLHKRRQLYVQGPRMSQVEPVVPRPRPMFGFGRLLCDDIRKVLDHVRRVRVFCGVAGCDGKMCGGDCKCDCTSCIVRRHDLEVGCKCPVCEDARGR